MPSTVEAAIGRAAPDRWPLTDPAVPRALVGPTASGKTEAGVELAARLGAEVVMIDSMTVYRGMDVGTAKPSAQQRNLVRHHLLDLADPSEPFSVARFQSAAWGVLRRLRRSSVPALLVGGSGLYYRAVVDELRFPGTDPRLRRRLEAEAVALGPEQLLRRLRSLDPVAAAKIEPGNSRRTVRALEVAALTGKTFSSFAGQWERYPAGRVRAAGIEVSPTALRRRIRQRVAAMLDGGLIAEVDGLRERGFGGFLTSSQAIGYREVALHLEGRLSFEEMLDTVVRRTRNLARRQMAWFRRDPRIRWFPVGEGGAVEALDDVEEHLRG
jgi:tRNA dimethylallyltransferase